jgi:hypothetical protein
MMRTRAGSTWRSSSSLPPRSSGGTNTRCRAEAGIRDTGPRDPCAL